MLRTIEMVVFLSVVISGCALTPESTTPAHTQLAQRSAPRALNAEDTEAVMNGIRYSLKDPNSAIFGTMFGIDKDDGAIRVCGWVNARNSFGGYTGQKPFSGLLVTQGDRKAFAIVAMGGTAIENQVVLALCLEDGVAL